MPSCGNSNSWLSKEHSEPDGRFSRFSDVNHWASRTFTTNQPWPAGARPEPESSSGASGTARGYECFGPVPPPLLPAFEHLVATAGFARRGRNREDLEYLQPYPDRLLEDLVARETVELAFITAIQLLPPKQRAGLILRDVLGRSAKETAEARDDSVAAVTSALQRARVSLEERSRHVPAPGA